MKKTLFYFSCIIATFGLVACLDNLEEDFPSSTSHSSSVYHSKGGNDSIPPKDTIDDDRGDTGGEQGQTPIKP